MIVKGGWTRYGTRCHGGDGATELGLVLAAVVGPLCGSSPGTVWSSRESGQRPLLWGVSGSQGSYCVARLTTAAARRARSDALAPLYSPRISCPPRPPVFGLGPGGPAQDTPPRARVRTPPGLLPAVTGYAAPCSGKNPARGRVGAPLQAWIHIQRPRRPPALCRLTGEAPARRACRGSLAPADPVSLQAWVHPQHPHRLPALLGQTGDPRRKRAPDPACFVLSQPAGGLCGAVCGLGVCVRSERADPPADFKFHVFTRLRGGGRYL